MKKNDRLSNWKWKLLKVQYNYYENLKFTKNKKKQLISNE